MKNFYARLSFLLKEGIINADGMVNNLSKLWGARVPSKIHLFGRRLMHSRFPTRMDLAKRKILFGLHNLGVPSLLARRRICYSLVSVMPNK